MIKLVVQNSKKLGKKSQFFEKNRFFFTLETQTNFYSHNHSDIIKNIELIIKNNINFI